MLFCAGKSTFLNSLLGDNLLPVLNVPCTACICQIRHKLMAENEQPFLTEKDPVTQVPKTVATGSTSILKHLEYVNDLARQDSNGSSKQVGITAQIPALVDAVPGVSAERNICIIDTPGD